MLAHTLVCALLMNGVVSVLWVVEMYLRFLVCYVSAARGLDLAAIAGSGPRCLRVVWECVPSAV